MGREVPFDKDAKCDNCGNIGSFDFHGDYLCVNCSFDSISVTETVETASLIGDSCNDEWTDIVKALPDDYKEVIVKDEQEEWKSYIYPSGEWMNNKIPTHWKC